MFEPSPKSFLKQFTLKESGQGNKLKIMCSGEKWLLG